MLTSNKLFLGRMCAKEYLVPHQQAASCMLPESKKHGTARAFEADTTPALPSISLRAYVSTGGGSCPRVSKQLSWRWERLGTTNAGTLT